MSDRAEKAAERIRKWAWPLQKPTPEAERFCRLAAEHIVSIIRSEYPEETVMQARAEHLEGVLRKVREAAERTWHDTELDTWRSCESAIDEILAILKSEAAGGGDD